MELKRVSFKVAKALKDAGYPQNKYENFFVEKDYHSFRIGNLYEPCNVEISSEVPYITAPTSLEVWLWLWREKKIVLHPEYYDKDSPTPFWSAYMEGCCFYDKNYNDLGKYDDPETAIIKAIEYLVDNKLLK